MADLVEGFAGGIVARLAEQAVAKPSAHFEQVGVAAAGDQRERRELDRRAVAPRLQDDGVDVALNVVDADEGHARGEAQALGVGQADQQRADEPGPTVTAMAERSSRRVPERCERFPDHGHDGAQVFARGQFGDHAAVLAVHRDLRGDDAERARRRRLAPRRRRFRRRRIRCRGYALFLP